MRYRLQFFLFFSLALFLSFSSCESTHSVSQRTPANSVQEYLQRVPGLIVSKQGLLYQNQQPIIVLDNRIVEYSDLLGMVNVQSIASVRLLKEQTDIKRWTNAPASAVVLVKTKAN